MVGTPLPGQPGNAVIAGRRTLYGGPFRRIGSLAPRRPHPRHHRAGNATYRVTDGREASRAGDGSFVQDHGDNRLTLFTSVHLGPPTVGSSSPRRSSGKPYRRRRLQRTLDADGLGLTGERDAAPNMLVWLELLAGAALADRVRRVALVAQPVRGSCSHRCSRCSVVVLRERVALAARDAVDRDLLQLPSTSRRLQWRAIPLLPGVHVRVLEWSLGSESNLEEARSANTYESAGAGGRGRGLSLMLMLRHPPARRRSRSSNKPLSLAAAGSDTTYWMMKLIGGHYAASKSNTTTTRSR